jgi:hypothetical protein
LLRNSTNNFDDEDIKNQLFNSRKKKKKRQRSALDQTKWEGKTSGLRGRARALESYHV